MTNIIQIDDILITTDLLTEYFVCDYEKCKGVCCVIGDSGAPLSDDETELLEKEYDNYSHLMLPEARAVVSRVGYYEIDIDGDKVTPLMRTGEECVYSCTDKDNNCFCTIEKSYSDKKTIFRKPMSCWLYPIRVSKLSSGMTALNLHRWDICKVAFEKGREEKTPVYKFLKEPIIYEFGEDFYLALESAAAIISEESHSQ